MTYEMTDVWHYHCIHRVGILIGFPRQGIYIMSKIISKVCKEIRRKWKAGPDGEGGEGIFMM